MTTTTYDIIQLDYAKPGQPTLRQMIMDIKCKDRPKVPLFYTVDLDWKGDGYSFQFSPEVGEEAACAMNTLVPYLSYFYPEANVEDYFCKDVKLRCATQTFNPQTGEVVDTSDGTNAYTFEFTADDDLEGFNFSNADDKANEQDALERPNKPKTKEPATSLRHMPGDEEDSVSTFRGGMQTSTAKGFNPSPRQLTTPSTTSITALASVGSDNLSAFTRSTIATQNSRLDKMETQFDKVCLLLQATLSKNNHGSIANNPGQAIPPAGGSNAGVNDSSSGGGM